MSEPSPLELAVELFIESGAQVRSWTTAFIAVNGALFLSLGAFVAWGDPTEDGQQFFNYVLAAICALGASSSAVLGIAALRQLSWNNHFRNRIRALQGEQAPLLPGAGYVSGGIVAAALTLAMTAAITFAWIALLLAISNYDAVVETSLRA
jgi:hypothetical protein